MWWSTASKPRSVDECAWSRQKVTELQTIIRTEMQPVPAGESQPNFHHAVVLMYGPSGCGKMVSVEPIVRSVAPDAIVRTHVMGDSLSHAEEQLEQFLLASWTSGPASHLPLVSTEFRGDGGGHGGVGKHASPSCRLHVQVVKLLSVDGSSEQSRPTGRTAVARVLDRFLRAIDQPYRDTAMSAAVRTAPPTSRKILTILVHTVHDTHSDKVHLNDNFSSTFLQHSAVRKFHCTPVTEIAVKRRLTAVWEAALRLAPLSSRRYLVSPPNRDTVARIASSCAGDIRQGLLQLQWEAINPLSACRGDVVIAKRANAHQQTSPSPTQSSPASRQKEMAFDVDAVDDCDEGAQAASELTDADCDDIPEVLLRPVAVAGKKQQRLVRQKRSRDDPSPTVETLLDDVEGEWRCSRTTATTQDGPRPADVLRNSSVDAGHASARLLTAKYDANQVLEVVTVPPGRLMNFVASNMHHYFSDTQVGEYASCAELLSSAERYFAPAEVLSEGSALDSGTAQSASMSSSQADSLSVVGFRLFVFGYRAIHKSITPPRTFLSHAPLKYFPAAFPRFTDDMLSRKGQGRGRRNVRRQRTELWYEAQLTGEIGDDDVGSAVEVDDDEKRLTQFLAALDATAAGLSATAPPLVEVVDVLRRGLCSLEHRCGSATEAAVDVFPLAGLIVFEDRRSAAAAGPGPVVVGAFPPSALPSSTTLSAPRGPVKTLMKLTCAGCSPTKPDVRSIARNQLLSLKILRRTALQQRTGHSNTFRHCAAPPSFQLRPMFSATDRLNAGDRSDGNKDACDSDPIEEA